jgi:hypothetical protein
MFEYVSRKRDPVVVLFYCGTIPFGILWAVRPSLGTGFLLEAYLITMGTFAIVPFETRQQDVKQRWYWKFMLRAGSLVHMPMLACLWYIDATYPSFVTGTGTLIFVAFVIAVIEMVVLGEIVDRFRPSVESGGAPPGHD